MLCIGNSMISRSSWHKYREWYFKIVLSLVKACKCIIFLHFVFVMLTVPEVAPTISAVTALTSQSIKVTWQVRHVQVSISNIALYNIRYRKFVYSTFRFAHQYIIIYVCVCVCWVYWYICLVSSLFQVLAVAIICKPCSSVIWLY